MTLKELKAYAYDIIVQIETLSREIERLRKDLKANEEAILKAEFEEKSEPVKAD